MGKAIVLILCVMALFSLLGLNANVSVSINCIHVTEFGAGFSPSSSLEWNRTYGGTGSDLAMALVQTTDGGYALAGYTTSCGAGSSDFWLVKTDASGNEQWNKTYGGAYSDIAESIIQTNDGGYALAGPTYSFGAGSDDFWLVKTDANGDLQWNKTYGGTGDEYGRAVIQTDDGGYTLTGSTKSFGAGMTDFWLVKTDASGNHLWNKTYGGTSLDDAQALVQTADGGYTLTGRGSFGAGMTDFWLVKTDAVGNHLWNKTYGGASDDRAYELVQTADGGYVLAGYTLSFGAGGGDFWLAKTDASGNPQWNKAYGGEYHDSPFTLVQTADEGYALAGLTYSFGAGGSDIWLVKTDANGDAQWNQTYGGTGEDYAGSVVQTGDGGYALAGGTSSFGAGSDDFWLVKTLRDVTTIIVPDDYSTIQEAINNADDGDTVFVKAGTYYEHVVVNRTVSLVGEDASTTTIDGSDTGHVVHVVRDNANITGFTVRNSGHTHAPYLEAGICLNGTTGCVISDNRVIDNGFSGISLLHSQYSRIVGNNVSGTDWGGIHMLGSSYNIVSRNAMDNTTHEYGVGINGHASSHYNTITENVISNSRYGMFYHDSRYNSICRNNISAISVIGIWLQDTVSHNVVAENSLINCTVGIFLEGPNTNNTLSANFITGAEYGIKILNAQNNRIVNNTIVNNRAGSDSWRAGIRLEGGGYSQIHSNLISGNYYGVLLYSNSPYVSAYGNNMSYNEFGFRVASGGSSYLNVSENAVTNNRGYGIGLTGFGGGSNSATIKRNLILNNSDGIALGQYSNYNTITQNNISTNDNGLYIEYSTWNIVYSNNIVDNNHQVNVTYPSTNTWDNGYTGGGNHWSDYNGSDQFDGSYQNVTGSDGVGDTPYVIDINNSDRYPSMEPCPTTYHNMAVTGTELSKSVVGRGYSTVISVTVENQGDCAETSNVTIYANEAILAEVTHIELRGKTSSIVNFTWNTTDIAYGSYSVSAYVFPVVGETYTEDNAVADAWVLATIPGDVNGDKKVNIFDCILVAIHMNHTNGDDHTPGSKEWTDCLNCNINSDTGVNMLDATILSSQFGQSWS